MASQFEQGLLVGLLVGEGHFGGDGRQPQVTLRMHVRHAALFAWIERTFPGGRLYGPYDHDGRRYYQWMARGAFLRDVLAPMLDRQLSPALDQHSWERFLRMRTTYERQLGPAPALGSGAPPAGEENRTDRAAAIFEQLRQAERGAAPPPSM